MPHAGRAVQPRVGYRRAVIALTHVLALWFACTGATPTVVSVTPTSPRPGAVLAIDGTDLDADGVSVLGADGTSLPIPAEPTETGLQAVLPEDLPVGPWRVVARHGNAIAEHQPVVQVWSPDTEPPCRKRFALETHARRVARQLVVTRTYVDEDAERELLDADVVSRLERLQTTLDDGRTCTALWAVHAGGRTLLADDVATDLAKPAQALADAIGVPLASP